MLLRRLTVHVKTQNWFAVALDFFVVVVGVFLAFQVEQWYADHNLRKDEERHLLSLQEDFQGTRQSLLEMHIRYGEGRDAALRLIKISRA